MDEEDITVQQQQSPLYFLPPPCSCFPFPPSDIRSLISFTPLSLLSPFYLHIRTHTLLPFRQAHTYIDPLSTALSWEHKL